MDYSYIGIRVCTDDESYKIGETCRNSYDWDYENDCSSYNTDPAELDGTCAIKIDAEDMTIEEVVSLAKSMDVNYCGDQVILIGGYEMEYGADENEVIIKDAVVLATL